MTAKSDLSCNPKSLVGVVPAGPWAWATSWLIKQDVCQINRLFLPSEWTNVEEKIEHPGRTRQDRMQPLALIVDDSAGCRLVLRIFLERNGFHGHGSIDGAEAVVLLAKGAVACLQKPVNLDALAVAVGKATGKPAH